VSAIALTVSRVVAAPVERVWAAWTQAELMQQWWGPEHVVCTGVEIDLRVGGTYRIGNRTPDGGTVWIHGRFEAIEPPHRLVYGWFVGDGGGSERVTVRFDPDGPGTRVRIVHERITDEVARASHQAGWIGCQDGLVAMFDG
jgi:uncharacterized protein YndB with AHSA1/START domain